MQTSLTMRKMIELWEGLRLVAYYDMVGVLTIGYGHTGSDVHQGLKITQTQADQLLTNDLHKFEIAVNHLAPKTTQNQLDALVSFSFNLGSGALASSTLLRLHNKGDYINAAAQFKRWDHAGGIEVPALLKRREAEAVMYLK